MPQSIPPRTPPATGIGYHGCVAAHRATACCVLVLLAVGCAAPESQPVPLPAGEEALLARGLELDARGATPRELLAHYNDYLSAHPNSYVALNQVAWRLTYASTACVNASMPEAAITLAGQLARSAGSSTISRAMNVG